jgi:hypothetical protein
MISKIDLFAASPPQLHINGYRRFPSRIGITVSLILYLFIVSYAASKFYLITESGPWYQQTKKQVKQSSVSIPEFGFAFGVTDKNYAAPSNKNYSWKVFVGEKAVPYRPCKESDFTSNIRKKDATNFKRVKKQLFCLDKNVEIKTGTSLQVFMHSKINENKVFPREIKPNEEYPMFTIPNTY